MLIRHLRGPFVAALSALVAILWAGSAPPDFQFVVLGDRTGSAQAGVYEQAWKEAAAERPALVLSGGDNIQGLDDAAAEAEWGQFRQILKPFSRYPFYAAPGNHDIWSEKSEQLFAKYTGHPPHYSFDYEQAHFTILDNSRTDELPQTELDFLKSDLQAHAKRPLKFVVSHRPWWLLSVVLGNAQSPIQRLAHEYGVTWVIAGHVHQMLHADLNGVGYISLPSSGGHLRNSKKYVDGWFYGYVLAEVKGGEVHLRIKELGPPHGQGRVTEPKDWGVSGLSQKK